MKCRNQLLLCAVATLALAMFTSGDTTFSEYTITPSSELVYYNYPVPIGNQFEEVPQRLTIVYNHVQQQVAKPNYVANSGSFQPPYRQSQRQYSTNPFLPVPYPPEYALFRRPQRLQQQVPQQQQIAQPDVAPVQQYAAPVLQQNDFTLALTHQGYKLGPAAGTAVRGGARSLHSLNVKLPLPLGLTPLNNAPLPLQSGASFDTLPRDVTSYGTKHPLKV